MIVMGPSGSGKTSLLRVLGGLWPFEKGTIYKPDTIGRDGIFFLPQRPYITLGTLKQQLIYPHRPDEQMVNDDELIDILKKMDLNHLLYFENGLNETKLWQDMLSGGEQQRIGFARLFYHKPRFCIMDEATSALDVELEDRCMSMCKEYDITLISVGHRPTLIKHHVNLLRLDGFGSFTIEKVDKKSLDSKEKKQVTHTQSGVISLDNNTLFENDNVLDKANRNYINSETNKNNGLKRCCSRFHKLSCSKLSCNKVSVSLIILLCASLPTGIFLGASLISQTCVPSIKKAWVEHGDLASESLLNLFIYSTSSGFISLLIVTWVTLTLSLEWRSNLIIKMQRMYFRGLNIYNVNNLSPKNLDNVDQRVTADLKQMATNVIASFFDPSSGLVVTFFKIALSMYQLKNIFSLKVLYFLLYGLFFVVLSIWLSKKVAAAMVEKQKQEGSFRHIHARAAEFSESIAFYRGESKELAYMNASYGDLYNSYELYVRQNSIFYAISSFVRRSSTIIAALFYVWIFRCDPMNPPGQPYVTQHIISLTIFFNATLSLPTLFYQFAESIGLINRVGYLYEELEQNAAMADNKDIYDQWNGRGHDANNVDTIAVKDLICCTPDKSKVLFDNMSFEVKHRESMIVMGPSGSGKTSLLRVLGGLWPFEKGTIYKPDTIGRDGIFFLPQRPYITLGTLKQQLIYPHRPDEQMVNDDELIDILKKMDLNHLLYFENGLNETKLWQDMLSGGEQQRIGFARLFYHKPRFCIMDEATSALDVELEDRCMSMCKEYDITLISVGHRPTLIKHHVNLLRLDGFGSFAIEKTRERACNTHNVTYKILVASREKSRFETHRGDQYDFEAWQKHESPFRNFRHLKYLIFSKTFRRILPNLVWIGGLSSALSYYNAVIVPELGSDIITFAPLPLTMTGTALGLLLVFRTQSSNTRFNSAREKWGSCINHARVLLRMNQTYIAPKDKNVSANVARLMKSFPKTLYFHLLPARSTNVVVVGKSHRQGSIDDLNDKALSYFLKNDGHSKDTVASIMSCKNRPYAVLQLLSNQIGAIQLEPIHDSYFQRSLKVFDESVGGCERILRTPIPTGYTRHTDRFLTVWTSLTPFALYAECGPIGTPCAALFIAFALYTIDDIGVTIEMPFDSMPMWRYVETIEATVEQSIDPI
eukprot:g1276.t1